MVADEPAVGIVEPSVDALLGDALLLEHEDPRGALRALTRAERANRDFDVAPLVVSAISVGVAVLAAFAVTETVDRLETLAAILIVFAVGFVPPMLLYFARQQRQSRDQVGWPRLVVTTVLGAVMMMFHELLVVLAAFALLVPVALILGPLISLIGWILDLALATGPIPDLVWGIVLIPLFVLALAVVLADVLPIVMLAPQYGLREVLAGLWLNVKGVIEFVVVVGLGSLVVGVGEFGLVYRQWWEAGLIGLVAGTGLGLTLAPLERDATISQLIELARARCDIRLRRLGTARWRLRHLLGRTPAEYSFDSATRDTDGLTRLLAQSLQGASGQRWWATGTTFHEMGDNFATLLFRESRWAARLDWARTNAERIGRLRASGLDEARRLRREEAWAQSVTATLQIADPDRVS